NGFGLANCTVGYAQMESIKNANEPAGSLKGQRLAWYRSADLCRFNKIPVDRNSEHRARGTPLPRFWTTACLSADAALTPCEDADPSLLFAMIFRALGRKILPDIRPPHHPGRGAIGDRSSIRSASGVAV